MKNIKEIYTAMLLLGSVLAISTPLEAQTENDPVAVCQDITKMLNANGTLNVNPQELDGGSYDNNGPVTFTADINYLFCEHIGVNPVTLLVSNNEGYVSVCSANVTVVDLIAPSAVCKDFTIELDDVDQATISFSDVDNGSSDNCSLISMNLSKSEFTLTDLGPNEITVTLVDESGNSSQCLSNVQVQEQPAFHPYDQFAALITPTPEEYDTDNSDKGSELSMNLYPNPAMQGQTTIALSNMAKGQKEITVILYDSFGVGTRFDRYIERDIEMKIKLDRLDNLITGVYTVYVNIDGKIMSKHLAVR